MASSCSSKRLFNVAFDVMMDDRNTGVCWSEKGDSSELRCNWQALSWSLRGFNNKRPIKLDAPHLFDFFSSFPLHALVALPELDMSLPMTQECRKAPHTNNKRSLRRFRTSTISCLLYHTCELKTSFIHRKTAGRLSPRKSLPHSARQTELSTYSRRSSTSILRRSRCLSHRLSRPVFQSRPHHKPSDERFARPNRCGALPTMDCAPHLRQKPRRPLGHPRLDRRYGNGV